jgi:hypothetical protein
VRYKGTPGNINGLRVTYDGKLTIIADKVDEVKVLDGPTHF